jgi:hypothetical protein
MNTDGVVPWGAAAVALSLCACSSVAPVGPGWTVRGAGYLGEATATSGSSMAQDGRQETPLKGDQMDFDKDLGLDDSSGAMGVVEARLSPDSELRASFERFHEFSDTATLDRTRRFDGRTYAPGTRVHGALEWDSAAFSYGHRIAAVRGEGPPVDVLARVGAAREQFLTKVRASSPPFGDRFAVAGAPFVGVEARIGILDDLMLVPGVDAGGLNDGDKRLRLADAQIELRWNVAGPLDLSAAYQFSGRHLVVQRGDGERTDVRSNIGVWLVGVGLHF